MSFKFFRKHQKVMLWFVVILAIFTFTIFSVQSTMRTCFTQERVDDMGEFTLKDGTKVRISVDRWRTVFQGLRSLAYLMRQEFNQALIVPHIVIHDLASRAGLMVSDKELGDTITEFIPNFFGGTMPSQEDYRGLLVRGVGFKSVSQFEEIFREMLVVERFKAFQNMSDDLFLTEEIYEAYKVENEELKIDYLAFAADNHTDQVDPAAFEEEEISEYYKTLRPGIGQEDLTIWETFVLDFAYVNTEGIDFEAFAELTADVTIEATEVDRYYEVVKERYKIEAETPENGDEETATEDEPSTEEEPAAEEEPATAEETAPAEESAAEYRDLAEVRDELEKELKVLSLIDKAEKEWSDWAQENKLLDRPGLEEEENEDETGESGDEPDPAAFFQGLCDKYGLSRKTIENPVSWDTLAELELFGSEGFKRRAKSLREGYSIVIKPCADCATHVAFLVRVVEREDAKLKELSEVRDQVLEDYAQKKRMELAEGAADKFKDAMRAKARGFEEVKFKVEEILSVAEEDIKKRIEDRKASDENYTDEMAQTYREGAMRRAESQVDRELDPYLHRVYEETCTEMGSTPVVLDYFPKTEAQSRTAPEDATDAEKFLKSRMGFIVSQLQKDHFSNPLRDNDGNVFYLVHMSDRRFPPPSTMSYEDITNGRERIELDKMIARWQARQGAGAGNAATAEDDPFSAERIEKDYNVIFYQREESEEEAPPEE